MDLATLSRPRKQPAARTFAGRQANKQKRQPHDPWWTLRDRYVQEMRLAHQLQSMGELAAAVLAFRCAWRTGFAWDYRIVKGPCIIPPSLVEKHREALAATRTAVAEVNARRRQIGGAA